MWDPTFPWDRPAPTFIPVYMVEVEMDGGYLDIRSLGAEVRRAAGHLKRGGEEIRFIRVVFVPEQGACLVLLEAGSAALARRAVSQAGVRIRKVGRVLRETQRMGGRA